MKKDIYKILFAIVCMFMAVGLIVANSDYLGGNAGGDAASGGGQTDPSNEVVSDGLGNKNYTIGIRLMFYTSSGQKIHAQDYVAQQYVNQTIYTQYGTGTPCGKIDNCAIGAWTLANNVKSINELTNALGVNVHNVLANKSLAKEKLFSTFLNAQSIDKAKQIISPIFPYNIDNYYNAAADAYDLFIVWEPLGIIKDKRISRNMIGTSRELVAEVKNMDASGAKYLFNGNDIGAWGGLGNAVTKYMGCSAFLEYELDFGRRVNQKFRSFTETSYFNGKLNLLNSFASTECKNMTKDALEPLANNNSSDYAVGVLWFDDYDEGTGITCDTINNYSAYGGKDNICNTINTTGTFNFSAFNRDNAGNTFPFGAESGINAQWYKTNCCNPPEAGGIDCTPQYNVPSCTTGENKTLTYKDSTDWERCIFTDENVINGVSTQNKYTIDPHKWSDKNQSLTYYDENLSSPYCEVYCIEEVYGNFDARNPEVLAGRNFTWGWSTVTSKRTCKTNGINIEKFADDLRRANNDVIQQLLLQKLHDDNNNRSWSQDGEDRYIGLIGTYSCTSKSVDGVVKEDDCGAYVSNNSCSQTSSSCGPWVGQWGSGQSCEISFNCTGTYDCTPYKYDTVTSATVYVDGSSYTKRINTVSACVNKSNPPSGNPVDRGNVAGAINAVNRIIADFNKCYDFADSNILNEQSKAIISYISSNNTYDYSGDMKKDTSYSTNEDICTVTKQYTVLNNCDANGCSNTRQNMYNCESHTGDRTATTDFSLEDGVYQFVIKNPNGLTLKSVNTSSFNTNYKNATTSNYKRETVYIYNWTDIGGSNFPVPFNAAGQSYQGSLVIEYSNLGHTSTPGSTDVDTILNSAPSYGTYGNWSCGYTVKTELIEGGPNDGDINVIYREIDLYNPFPDTNSNGRHTGANWCSHENCDYDSDNVVVNEFILQNRDVTGDELYGLEPMYTFIMTPSDIIKIRKYNDNNTYSSYEGTLGGKKYTFTCTRGSLRNCRSDYLSQLLTDLDATNLPGTCKNDRQVYQGDTASSRFEKCRY